MRRSLDDWNMGPYGTMQGPERVPLYRQPEGLEPRPGSAVA